MKCTIEALSPVLKEIEAVALKHNVVIVAVSISESEEPEIGVLCKDAETPDPLDAADLFDETGLYLIRAAEAIRDRPSAPTAKAVSP